VNVPAVLVIMIALPAVALPAVIKNAIEACCPSIFNQAFPVSAVENAVQPGIVLWNTKGPSRRGLI
jgi:hypothetical protein